MHSLKLFDVRKTVSSNPSNLTLIIQTLFFDANGAPHPDSTVHAKKNSGKFAHRIVNGGLGHNLPQEVPKAFVVAFIRIDSYSN